LLKALESNKKETTPIFCVSCVSGFNLDLLKKFLNGAPSHREWNLLENEAAEVVIDETYDIPNVGTVVAGTVSQGKVVCGAEMLLGPSNDGLFSKVTITSIHRSRVPVNSVHSGCLAAFALKNVDRSETRKGMVLLDLDTPTQAVWSFEAAVVVFNLQLYSEPVVQCRTIRQTVKVVALDERNRLNSSGGDSCVVSFRFLHRPEYIKVGLRVIFRGGSGKGIGIITKVKLPEFEDTYVGPSKKRLTGEERLSGEQVVNSNGNLRSRGNSPELSRRQNSPNRKRKTLSVEMSSSSLESSPTLSIDDDQMIEQPTVLGKENDNYL